MARVIAIANQKGGVGKTTTAVNLGASLAASEQHTLIIDSDPQGNATSALGFAKDPARRTLYQALILGEPIERVTIDAQIDGLDLIPSDKNLVGAAVELISMDNREYRLKEAIAPLREKYDFILIIALRRSTYLPSTRWPPAIQFSFPFSASSWRSRESLSYWTLSPGCAAPSILPSRSRESF